MATQHDLENSYIIEGWYWLEVEHEMLRELETLPFNHPRREELAGGLKAVERVQQLSRDICQEHGL